MPQSKQCPKCAGSMAEGFVIDRTHGGVGVSSWVEGTPKRSLWTGVDLARRSQFNIASWRCSRCGFLESYVADEPDGSAASQKRAVALVLIIAVGAAMLLAIVGVLLAHRPH